MDENLMISWALIGVFLLCWKEPLLARSPGRRAVGGSERHHRRWRRLASGNEGGAAVEFAIILNLLMLLILGMVDLGHAWFIRQTITNASREGARLGVVYHTPPTSVTDIQASVRDYLKPSGLDDPAITTVNVSGAGGASGTQLVVTVISRKDWWIIDNFVPSLGPSIQMTAVTSMRLE